MQKTVGVIGLGYVGLPLAVALAKKHRTVGFDIKRQRIHELTKGYDRTGEVEGEVLKSAGVKFSDDPEALRSCNVFIITVPTPIDRNKRPDLSALVSATNLVGSLLKKGDLVIYESTVYPGCTEEVCVPILEEKSRLKFNVDFFCGYSPERMNPGDKNRTLSRIVKVTSGSTPAAAESVDRLYRDIVEAGTFRTSSIRVAEAAKAIENAQRDINIAFVNELALIFNRMGLDTLEILEAAGTKWNFVNFKPGLVGGHCIGVDPYYLTFKAEELGYHPEVILAGRRINDNMGVFVANQVMKLMVKRLKKIERPKVLILGMTFKENCPDIRNSRVIDIYRELSEFGCDVSIFDPYADQDEVRQEYEIIMETSEVLTRLNSFSSVIFAVAHDAFKALDIQKKDFPTTILYDLKGIFPPNNVDARL